MPTYIIEHLEPRVWKWCLIEYKNISKLVGKNNLWFTNIKSNDKASKELKKYGKVMKQSVRELSLTNVCVLDPETPKTLNSKEAKKFKYYIFGGILGDYPPKKRTKVELTQFIKGAKVRNIGKEQMSTDNAVYTVKQIVNGTPLKDLKFKDNIEIKINDIESVSLPYRYNLVKGKPFISNEILTYLKRKKGF